MEVPEDPGRVGWWVAGAAPADPTGTTVLVGHLDSATRGIGVFAALLTLPADAELALVDSAGITTTYRLSERQQLAKADLPPTLFDRTGSRRLVLITCGGAFDPRTHHYADNVVVTAVPVPR